MVNRLPLVLIVAFGFFGLSVSSWNPLSKPHTSDAIEKIYAPFDSLRTDLKDYRWPTEIGLRITSGFADFRSFHFHAGVDISTNGRKGYRVYASRRGYISRIWISPYGYGKMLFVHHLDGFSTTYAHLQHFSAPIDSFVKRQQYSKGTYSIDVALPPEQFPVQQGDVIAYTGNTGTGNPHLHFEIRDESMNPVDPLLVPGFASLIPDKTPPMFKEIAFSPMSATSLVQGDSRPWISTVTHRRGTEYGLPTVLHLTGGVGVSVKAVDWIGTSYYATRANHYEVYLDDGLLFSSDISRFPFKDIKQIAVHYDWSFNREGRGLFQKLYVDEGNQLPFYGRQPEGSGILETGNFDEGFHQLRIVARDLSGNRSEFHATLVFNRPPEFEVRTEQGKLLVESEDTSLASLLVGSGSSRKHPRTIRRVNSLLASTRGQIEIPLSTLHDDVVKLIAKDRYGTPSRSHFVVLNPPKSSNTSLGIEKEFIRDFVYVSVSSHLPFTLRPSVWVSSGERRQLIDISAAEANRYVGTFQLEPENSGPLKIEASADINGASMVQAYDEASVYPITPAQGGTIESEDFRVVFPPDAVYHTLYCRIEKRHGGYMVTPDDVVLNKGATVEYKLPTLDPWDKVGLFHDNGEGWELLDWCEAGQKSSLTGHIDRLLGDFALFVDNTGPKISGIRCSSAKGRLRLSFRIQDNLAGTAADSIQIRIDGQPVIGEYDPYRRLVTLDDEFSLLVGGHLLTIQAQDRLGNKSSGRRMFYTY